MQQSDKILAYEDISREIDFFAGDVSQEVSDRIDDYKSQITYILDHCIETRKVVDQFQAIKKQLYGTSLEFTVLRTISQGLGRDMIRQNATRFLGILEKLIEGYLLGLGCSKADTLFKNNLGRIAENTFNDVTQEIHKIYGDTGVIIFLRRCIGEGKVIQNIIEFAEQKCTQEDNNTFGYWEYRNLEKLAQTKQKLQEGDESSYESVSVSLSGGNMNGISQVGIIEGILESGKNISCISGTSIGAVIGVIVAQALDPNKSPEDNVAKWREIKNYLITGFIGEEMEVSLEGNIFSQEGRKSIMLFFIVLGNVIGIDETTTFSELQIPVVVNGSRYYKGGEQQIYMGAGDRVLESIIASVNIYGNKFGDTHVDETLIGDHAASKQLNAVEGLKLLGKYDENTYLVDTGSGSSDMQRKGISEKIIRLKYEDTTRRDVLERLTLKEKKGGTVIAPDLTSIYGFMPNNFPNFPLENFFNIGQSITPEQAKQLINLGNEAVSDAQ